MSWHYLQGQEEASWAGNCLDGAPSALLKLIHTRDECSLRDKRTDASIHSLSGMTLRRSTGTSGAASLMWFRGDSPVRTYRLPEKGPDSMENDLACGPRWPGSLARCNPPLSGWKTRQCSLFGGLTEFSGTWPRWGMMRDGELSELATPVHLTNGNDAGLWPTPTKTIGPKRSLEAIEAARMKYKSGQSKFNPGVTLEAKVGGVPNPKFVAWLMGWPINWTSLRVSATDKFRQWCASHGIPSPEDAK